MEIWTPETENQELLRQYRSLLRACKPRISDDDRKNIRKAFDFAVNAHQGMRRKSGEPYIFHPVGVARIAVEEIGLGATSVICSLLHDVVEDTDYTLTDIEALFGKKIASIIDGLTKISGIFDQQETSIQAENFRKILLTLSEDVRVILIKLADRLHNMRTLDSMVEEKRLKIASETVYLYAPLSHRLGLYTIKNELEDLALKYTEPEIFTTISKKISQSELERKQFITKFLLPIKKELNEKQFKYEISYRAKSINSIWNKMRKKGIPFEEVFDLFAIRVIVDTPADHEKADCWKVYSIITDHYRPKMDRLRDWISIPKANGYESLHTTVMSKVGKWVEIQIRSKRMDEIAERGFAAHWKYKGDSNAESGLDMWLEKIKEILQNPESNALDFLDEFKLNLFSDEIYVFTPKGELRNLPVNSTALDFAYSIHSHIGNNAIGAKVNHKLVPLNYQLKSGDQVEIITSKMQKPKEDWYNYANTARAKTQIKNAIKEEKKNYIEQGKELLKAYFESVKLEYSVQNIRNFQNYVNIQNTTEFYYKVAVGEIISRDVKEYAASTEKSLWLKYISRPLRSTFIKDGKPKTLSGQIREELKKKPGALLLGQNIDNIEYTLSTCCNPIPGDDVIGFIREGQKIKIHRTNCQDAIQLMSTFGNSIVKAKWTNNESISFLTGIKLSGIDRFGLVNEISKVISEELNINIRSFSIESSDGMMEGTAMLYVQDTPHLNDLISKLKKVKGVQKVSRIN